MTERPPGLFESDVVDPEDEEFFRDLIQGDRNPWREIAFPNDDNLNVHIELERYLEDGISERASYSGIIEGEALGRTSPYTLSIEYEVQLIGFGVKGDEPKHRERRSWLKRLFNNEAESAVVLERRAKINSALEPLFVANKESSFFWRNTLGFYATSSPLPSQVRFGPGTPKSYEAWRAMITLAEGERW